MNDDSITKTEEYSEMTGVNSTAERLDDDAFVALLGLFMEADPWPFSVNQDPIEDFLDSEARARGYSDWIEALHRFTPASAGGKTDD